MEAQEPAVEDAVHEIVASRRLARPTSPPGPVMAEIPASVPVVTAPETLEEIRDAFQRQYFSLLLKPEVMTAVERCLRKKKNPRDAIEMFKAVVAGLQPGDTKNTLHARNITVVSRLARPAKKES